MRERARYIHLRAGRIAGEQRPLIDEASVERHISGHDLSDLKRRRGELDVGAAAHAFEQTARTRLDDEYHSRMIFERVIRRLAPSFFNGGRARDGRRMV